MTAVTSTAETPGGASARWWRSYPPRPWWRIPLYPAAFAAAFVLIAWGNAGLPLTMLVRPLAVAVLATLGLTLLVALVLGERDRAALVASSVIGALVVSDDRLAGLLIVIGLAVLIEGVIHRSQPHWAARIATRVLTGVGFIALAASVITITQAGVWGSLAGDLAEPALAPAPAPADHSLPDMYVFLLDAFPGDRAAAHAAATAYDTDAFPQELGERGFDVVRDAHSNYLLTPLTLSSMLSMRHLVDIADLDAPFGPRAVDWVRLRRVIDAAPAWGVLREHGYEITAIDGGYAHAHMARVDRFVEAPLPSELEVALINNTRLGELIGTIAPHTLADVARARIEWTFERAEAIAGEAHDRPRLVFVHVPAPHPPWVLDAHGGPRNPSFVAVTGEADLSVQESLDVGFDQADALADRTLAAVDRVRSATGDTAVMVVMSDHGPAAGFSTVDPLHSAIETRASNFMAAATPGHPGLIGDHLSPVNLFPALFDAYLGVHVDRQPDSIWAWRDSYIDAVEAPPIPGWSR